MDHDIFYVGQSLLEAGALSIRDIDGGEEPFLYSSGNFGPGYVRVKNLVSRGRLFRDLCWRLSEKLFSLQTEEEKPDFIAGNATGGMIPGWLVAENLDPEMPYVYIRGSRKKGGHKELITGIDNPKILPGDTALVVEELVDFSETTCNSAVALRESNYVVNHAACILFYQNPAAVKSLQEHQVQLIYLITLPELLEVAEQLRTHPKPLINDYRDFLEDPAAWQKRRGLVPVPQGGTLS